MKPPPVSGFVQYPLFNQGLPQKKEVLRPAWRSLARVIGSCDLMGSTGCQERAFNADWSVTGQTRKLTTSEPKRAPSDDNDSSLRGKSEVL